MTTHARTTQAWAVRPLTHDDAAEAAALAARVGWARGEAEWRRLLDWEPSGCFCVEGERGLIGTATTTTYGDTLAWIGMMIVDPAHRRQGVGSALLETCLNYLHERRVRRVMLDASDAGLPLYRRYGFRELYRVHGWRGRATEFFGPRARRITAADMSAVIAYDEQRFGAMRGRLLLRLQAEFPRLAWFDRDARGRVLGYVMARPANEQVVIGPWLHDSPWGATMLLDTALGAVRGRTVLLNLPDRNLAATPIAADHALRQVSHTTRMIWGEVEPPADEPRTIFAVASLATG